MPRKARKFVQFPIHYLCRLVRALGTIDAVLDGDDPATLQPVRNDLNEVIDEVIDPKIRKYMAKDEDNAA